MGIYVATAFVLAICLVLSWLAGSFLHLQGAALWLLRGILSILCLAGAGLFLWFHRKVKGEESGAVGSAMGADIELLLREADKKLRASRSKSGNIGSLPIIFILGEPGAAKTSVMLHSGIEPELLAGQVYEGSEVASTSTVNIWFARKTLFVEVGGRLLGDTAAWAKLLQKTRPAQFKSAFGKGEAPLRAALVCFDSERFGGGSEALAGSARRLASRLKEMAASLGADFPVYALFTRVDRIPHFTDYVSNLTQHESGEVLGVTLPRRKGSQGLFVEEESNRVNRSFDQLVYSLAEKRLDYLSRENGAEHLPSIYEFPRELRKLRTTVAQFLVELTKPTQLGANCFLRGYYFCGVRPVVVSETIASAAHASASAPTGSGATVMFKMADLQAPAPGAARVVNSRKVPEWTFLPHLFHEVILKDRSALGTSAHSAHVHTARRILLASAAFVFLIVFVAVMVSFFNNRALEQKFIDSATTLSRLAPAATETPTSEQLQELDRVRTSVIELQGYAKDGAPFSYRFGLYAGERVYPEAHRLYFQYFQRLLLHNTEANLLATLRQPPSTRTTDDFQQMYGTLKAYLITTSHHEKADWSGLAQTLLDHTGSYRTAEPTQQDLIRKQFAFYAAELLAENPYSTAIDANAVEGSRAYLRQFNGIEAIYQAMLDDAGRGKSAVNFSRRFPGASQVVTDSYEVPAAFTREGFQAMQKSLQNPDKFSGEEWVTGAQTSLNVTPDVLRTQLSTRYYNDYASQWRTFLRSAHVVGYGNLRDASTKLSRLVANDSPLLELFLLAKENTAVELPAIRDVFDSVQALSKDSTVERPIGAGNQAYMGALSQLQAAIATIASAPNPDPGMLAQGTQAASGARGQVTQISQAFRIDTQGRIDSQVRLLMEEPITQVERALKIVPNDGVKMMCAAVNVVTSKYPFNPRSSQPASVQEVSDVFRPQSGTFWGIYEAQLKPILLRQGNQFIPASTGVTLSPRFLGFMRSAAQFSDALFPNGSQTVHLGFSLRQIPSKGIDQASIAIDGQTVSGTETKQFVWTGADTSSVALSASSGTLTLAPPALHGSWALFEFFEGADWTNSNPATLEWPLQLQFGHQSVSGSARTAVRYELQTQGTQVFARGFLNNLHCSVR